MPFCCVNSGWEVLTWSTLGRERLPSFGGGMGRCLEELTERIESLSIGGGGLVKSGDCRAARVARSGSFGTSGSSGTVSCVAIGC